MGLSAHPPELLEADRRYFVPWGRGPVAAGLVAAVCGLVAVAALSAFWSPWWILAAVPAVCPGAWLALFFRNPRREVPSARAVLVAPADGTVRDILKVEEPEYVRGLCVRIGIFLSVFDVHLNRAPAAGEVEWVSRRSGRYHDARRPEASEENERCSIGIRCSEAGGPSGARILVRQIAGAIARRVVCPLQPGVSVARGGLIGMIKYGSRTELYIPWSEDLRVEVRVGDKVRAGSTIVASWAGCEGEQHGSE